MRLNKNELEQIRDALATEIAYCHVKRVKKELDEDSYTIKSKSLRRLRTKVVNELAVKKVLA